MALSINTWYISLTVIDKQNNASVVDYEINFGANQNTDELKMTAAKTLLTGFLAAFGAVTSSKVVRAGIRRELQETDASAPTLNNPEVNRKASLTMQLAGVPDKGLVVIPSPLDAIFVNFGVGTGGNSVNTDNEEVVAYCDFFTATGSADDTRLYISDGQSVQSPTPLVGKRTFRRTRKR